MSEPARIPQPQIVAAVGWARVDRVGYSLAVWGLLVLGFLAALAMALQLDWM